MGDAAEAIEVARASNEYGAELMKKYPEKIGVLASLPLPEIDAAVEEVKYCRENLQVTGFALQTNSCGMYLGDTRLEPVMEVLNLSLIHIFQSRLLMQSSRSSARLKIVSICHNIVWMYYCGSLRK